MESIYFPAFVIVAAGLVIWLFRRAHKKQEAADAAKQKRRPVNPRTGANPRRIHPNRARLQSGQGKHSPGDIWRRTRERSTKSSFGHAPGSGVYHASYANPDPLDRMAEQEVNEADFQGLDEYLTKRDADLARQAAEESTAGLSMRAMKFESGAENPEGQEKEVRQGTGFKP